MRSAGMGRWVSFMFVAAAVGCAGDETEPTEEIEQAVTSDSLPGGTSISVSVDSPPSGTTLPPGVVNVSGTAAVGAAVPVANTALIYVVDVSGSTSISALCGGDANGDGVSNTILDCEIASAIALNDAAATLGTVAQVGVTVFASSAGNADFDPVEAGLQLTEPGTDLDADGTADVVEVLRSAFSNGAGGHGGLTQPNLLQVGNLTSYGNGIIAAIGNVAVATAPNKIVVFLSDGNSNTAPNVTNAFITTGGSHGAVFRTFAIGNLANCTGGGTQGTLQQIADATGGTCEEVDDIADLLDILPGVIASHLNQVEIFVDGVSQGSADTVTPPLPQIGPVDVTWDKAVTITAPGAHTICARAHGDDAGGTGFVDECVTIVVNSPPVALCQDLALPAGPACIADGSVDAGSFDPDGQPIDCVQAPVGSFGLGATAVVLTCTDPLGASASCAASVTVTDVTPPALACPADQVLECANGGAVATYAPAATDNCAVDGLGCAPPSGTTFPVGASTVACSASDPSGNTSTCTSTISVVDTTLPVVDGIDAPIELWPPNHHYRTVTLAECIEAITDSCDGILSVATSAAIVKVTSDEVEDANGNGDGKTCDDAVIVGATTAHLRAERNGTGDGRVYTIHYEVEDGAGNVTPATCKVEVVHDQGDDGAVGGGCAFCTGSGCGSCPLPSPSCS